MGYVELALDLSMFMILANLALFIFGTSANLGVFACVMDILPSQLQENYPAGKLSAIQSSAEKCPISSSNLYSTTPAETSKDNFGDLVLRLANSVLASLANLLGYIGLGGIADFFAYISKVIYIIAYVLFAGWFGLLQSLHFATNSPFYLFFFLIGVSLTIIQFYGIVYFILLLIGRVKGGA